MRISQAASLAAAALAGLLVAGRAVAEPAAADSAAATTSAVVQEQALAGQVESLNEQVQALQGDMDKLKKLKFSGYIQARWEDVGTSRDSVKVAGSTITPANLNRFYIRRARLKLTYVPNPLSEGVLYIDGSRFTAGVGLAVRLLEAYVTLRDPWTVRHQYSATLGQVTVPFGYEIPRSSSAREVLERSRAANVLFPGERDRGFMLGADPTPRVKAVVGVFNGPGIDDAIYPTTAPAHGKPLLASVSYDPGPYGVGGSYYAGNEVYPLTGDDVTLWKMRANLNGQAYFATPRLGGGSVVSEYYAGHSINPDSVKALTATVKDVGVFLKPGVDPQHLSTDVAGWYVMVVQNLGDAFQLAVRYDTYDPNTELSHDQFQRWDFALSAFYAGSVRVTAQYGLIRTEQAVAGGGYTDPRDDVFQLQFQIKY